MALAADLARASHGGSNAIAAYLRTAAVTYYAGALVGLNPTTGALVLWSDTAGLLFKGLVEQHFPLSDFGINTTAPNEVSVNESGPVLERVNVVGVASQANVGDLVYATDDNTLTLTATVNVKAIGRISRWHTGVISDVKLFTPEEFFDQP